MAKKKKDADEAVAEPAVPEPEAAPAVDPLAGLIRRAVEVLGAVGYDAVRSDPVRVSGANQERLAAIIAAEAWLAAPDADPGAVVVQLHRTAAHVWHLLAPVANQRVHALRLLRDDLGAATGN